MTKMSGMKGIWTPFRIVSLYALIGVLWILFSDRVLFALITDPATLTGLQTVKGWFYVLTTALLLYFLIAGMFSRLKRMYRDLLREKEYSNNLIQQLPIGLALCTMDGSLVEVNPAFARILGRNVEETLKLTYWDITPEKYADQEKKQIVSLERTGRYGPYEKEYIHKDGHHVPVRLSGLIVDRGGEKLIWSSVEDITARVRSEEDRQLFFSLANNSKEFIGMADLNFTPFYANAAALKLVGLPDLEAVRKIKVQDIFFPEDQPFITNEFLPRVLREGSGEVEIRFRHFQTGEAIWVLYNVFTIQGTHGEAAGWATVSRNITERKQVEQELEEHREHLEELVQERTLELKDSQTALINLLEDVNESKTKLEEANEKLKELDRLKSMFIASMSHELRPPLNSSIGFSGIMLQGMSGDVNDEQRDHLERVFRAGKHLLGLITDVIDIAKIESGRIVPFVENFQLDELIEEAVGQVRQQAGEKGLVLHKHFPETQIVLHTDRRRLLQCLLNYLSNAVKFSEKGSINVEVAKGVTDRETLPDGWVEISIRDTGIGIRPEDLSRLFESFVRLESHLKTITPGTGLGLYLTKKLATEVLGGEVGVESEEGRGSRFWLRVPVCLSSKVAE